MSSTHVLRRSLLLCASVALLSSCAGLRFRYAADRELAALLAEPKPSYPEARFAVLSDPHLYDRTLGIEGPDFSAYMEEDRKLLAESEEILATAIGMVESWGVRFLLIPGDLTKDGEKQDHLLMARHLEELAGTGVRIYVVPGNHDIENPHARRFTAQGSERIPSIRPEEFAEIYKDFGYGSALFRDPASLSYVAEPVPGLWLLAVSSADYAENEKLGAPRTSGRLSQATVDWIEDTLGEALRQGKAVVAMMHHGILEHYRGQEKYAAEYVIQDYRNLSSLFAAYGVRVVFTGHYHSQDITLARWEGGRFLYDIETGSLVTAPNPVRSVEILPSGQMVVKTFPITQIPSFAQQGKDFAAYSEEFTHSGIAAIASKTMKDLGVPPEERAILAPEIADAVVAHYKGDEKFAGTEMIKTKGLSFMGGLVVGSRKDFITGLWTDLEPPDNDITVDLGSGKWSAGE